MDEVARRLVARGTDVTVLTTDPTGRLPRREDRHGVVVRRFPIYPRHREISICRPHWYTKSDLVRTTSSTFRDSPDSFPARHQGRRTSRTTDRRDVPARGGTRVVGAWPFEVAKRESRWRRCFATPTRWSRLARVRSRSSVRHWGQVGHHCLSFETGRRPCPSARCRMASPGHHSSCSVAFLEHFKGHHRLIHAAMPALCRMTSAPRLRHRRARPL